MALGAPARLSAAGFPVAVVGVAGLDEPVVAPMAMPATAATVAAPTPSVSRDGLVMRRFFVNTDKRDDLEGLKACLCSGASGAR